MARLKDPSHYSASYRRLQKAYGGNASAIRAEYRRVYAIIEKRWWRAMQAGFGNRQVTKNMGALKPISQIESNAELARSLSNAYTYLTNETYTLKGQRAARIKAIETQIRNKQLEPGASQTDVDLLFELARKRGTLAEYGSKTVQDAYKARQRSERRKDLELSARTRRRILLDEIERPAQVRDLKEQAKSAARRGRKKEAADLYQQAADLAKAARLPEELELRTLARRFSGIQSV